MKKREKKTFVVMLGAAIAVALLCGMLTAPLGAREITPEEAMQEYIEEAKKFSKELAEWFDEYGEDWIFWDGEYDRVNPDTGKIEISRPQLLAVLADIQSGDEGGEKAKNYKYQYVERLLHEGGHRQAVEDEKAYINQKDAEEVRNGTELDNRLIDILHELNKIICGRTPAAGDGENLYSDLTPEAAKEMFDLVEKMILKEREYREEEGYWPRLENALGIENIERRWAETVRSNIRTLKRMNVPNDEIIEYANGSLAGSFKGDEEYTSFKVKREALGVDLEITLTIDPETLEPVVELKIAGQPIGREIPARAECPETREEDPDSEQARVDPRGRSEIFEYIRFGVGSGVGWASLGLTDLKETNAYVRHLYHNCSVSTVSTSGFTGSFWARLELFARYILANSHELGLATGVQFLPGGTFSQDITSGSAAITRDYGVSFLSVPLEFFYKVPFRFQNRSLFLRAAAGLDFYKAAVDYDYTRTEAGAAGGSVNTFTRGKLEDSGLGGHVSVGLEYPLGSALHITLDAGYSFGKLDDFKGTVTDEKGSQYEVMLGKRLENGGYVLPFASGDNSSQWKPAEVNPGGFRISLGLRYYPGKPRDSQN